MNDKTMPEAVGNAFLTLTRQDSTPEESEARMFLMRAYLQNAAAQTPPRSESVVTDGMVDRGAEKLADEYDPELYWRDMGENAREGWRIKARIFLTAALTARGGEKGND